MRYRASKLDCEPGFGMQLGLKDLRLATAAAEGGQDPADARRVRTRMAAAVDAGMGDKDWSGMADDTLHRANRGRGNREAPQPMVVVGLPRVCLAPSLDHFQARSDRAADVQITPRWPRARDVWRCGIPYASTRAFSPPSRWCW